MKAFIIFMLLTFVMACSPASLATKALSSLAGGDSSGIAVETRIAKEANDSVVVGENSRTDIKATEVNITEVINKTMSTGLMVVLFVYTYLVWLIPSPTQMRRAISKYFTIRRKRKAKNGK